MVRFQRCHGGLSSRDIRFELIFKCGCDFDG